MAELKESFMEILDSCENFQESFNSMEEKQDWMEEKLESLEENIKTASPRSPPSPSARPPEWSPASPRTLRNWTLSPRRAVAVQVAAVRGGGWARLPCQPVRRWRPSLQHPRLSSWRTAQWAASPGSTPPLPAESASIFPVPSHPDSRLPSVSLRRSSENILISNVLQIEI